MAYEKYLRGTPSVTRVEIDVKGHVLRQLSYQPPVPGHDVYLTIDMNMQKIAEESLANQIATTRAIQDSTDKTKFAMYKAPGGSVTLVDTQTGFVRALASYPTFDPASFVEGIPTPVWKELEDPANAFPLNNRATQGLYAPGSTFKMVTSIAGTDTDIISPYSTFNDTGQLKVSDITLHNSGDEVNGQISLARALTVSSDTFFYNIGSKLWSLQYRKNPQGNAIQDTARDFGFGKITDIPIGNESKGRIPDQKWKEEIHKEHPAAFPYAEWLPGDNVNTAVGQGDTLVTPIQLAMAYGAFSNGGTLYQPQLVSQIRAAGSKKASTVIKPVVKKKLSLNATTISVMKQGFAGVISDPKGTASAAFSGWPSGTSAGGKTGTAQVTGKQDTSLFVGFSPVNNPAFVAVSVVEEAGWGAGTAAPIVRRTLEGALGLPLSSVGFEAPPGGAN